MPVITNSKKNKKNKKNKKSDINKPASFGVIRNTSISIPEIQLTREELWSKVRNLSVMKYSYELESSLDNMECLKSTYNKLACLRDLC